MNDRSYRNLVLACIVVVQCLMIGVIHLWPASENTSAFTFEVDDQELVFLDEIVVTRQESAPPPPPRPRQPVPVPSDEIIEEEIVIETEIDLSELPPLSPGIGTSESGDENRIVGNPQVAPVVVRIVEASAPASVPAEYKGKLEMIVNFLVDRNGDVEEANVMEIRLYDDTGGYEELPHIEQGLMDAVITASMQWRFRPARQDGEAVKAFTRQRFNY